MLRTVQPCRLACDLLATSGRHRPPAAGRTGGMDFDSRLMTVPGLRPGPRVSGSGCLVGRRPGEAERADGTRDESDGAVVVTATTAVVRRWMGSGGVKVTRGCQPSPSLR